MYNNGFNPDAAYTPVTRLSQGQQSFSNQNNHYLRSNDPYDLNNNPNLKGRFSQNDLNILRMVEDSNKRERSQKKKTPFTEQSHNQGSGSCCSIL